MTSDGSVKQLSPALFFQSAVAKETTEIEEAVGTGDNPGLDSSWSHWTSSNPSMVYFYLRAVISDCLLIGFIRATETLKKRIEANIFKRLARIGSV